MTASRPAPEARAAAGLHAELVRRVKDAMTAAGWNQADLAFAANVSTKHLSQMLTGRVDGTLTMWQHLLDTLPVSDSTPEPTDEPRREYDDPCWPVCPLDCGKCPPPPRRPAALAEPEPPTTR